MKLSKVAKETLEIHPVIKINKLFIEKIDVCPHCRRQIREKESYMDPDGYCYHRPCQGKGPIEKIDVGNYDINSLMSMFGGGEQKEEPPILDMTGYADKNGTTEKDVDAQQLDMGIKIEMEHTNDPDVAKQIALDHLTEIPDYYTRLERLEEEAKREGVMKDIKK